MTALKVDRGQVIVTFRAARVEPDRVAEGRFRIVVAAQTSQRKPEEIANRGIAGIQLAGPLQKLYGTGVFPSGEGLPGLPKSNRRFAGAAVQQERQGGEENPSPDARGAGHARWSPKARPFFGILSALSSLAAPRR